MTDQETELDLAENTPDIDAGVPQNGDETDPAIDNDDDRAGAESDVLVGSIAGAPSDEYTKD